MYFTLKVVGVLMIGIGLLTLAILATRVDAWTLSPVLPIVVFGYIVLRRTVRVVSEGPNFIRFRGGGYDATITPQDVVWVMQSGYPLMRHALVVFWLRPSRTRPRFLMTVNDPSRDLLPVLRAWGKLIADWGGSQDR